MAVLDTAVIIDVTRRHAIGQAVRSLLSRLRQEGRTLYTTRFSLAELYAGAALSSDAGRELERVEENTGWLITLEFDDRAARTFGSITAHLRRIGRPAGDMDVLIASVALANGHALVTRKLKHFADIPRLEVRGY